MNEAMNNLDLATLRKAAEGVRDDPRTYYASFGPVEILSLLDRIEALRCPACSDPAVMAGGPDCKGCAIGGAQRFIDQLLKEKFYLDFAANRWIGQCGHSWQREDDAPPICPYCAINNEKQALLDRIEDLETLVKQQRAFIDTLIPPGEDLAP